MKYLIIISLALTTITSCKKDPAKKAFLTGRLIDGCSGNPVANQKLNFYRNFKESNSWLIQDTDAKLLESVNTNENGVFYFYGEDYVREDLSSYSNGSVRIGNQIIATGNLGKHYKSDGDEYSNPDLGDLLLNGSSLDVDFKIGNNYLGNRYDSVKLSSSYYDVYLTLSDTIQNYFTGSKANQQVSIKNFWNGENNGKYNLYIKLDFYRYGEVHKTEWKDVFFDPCVDSGEFTFEF